jgi:hypothetical protein
VKYQESLRYLSNLAKKMNKFNSLLDQQAKKVINEELSNYGQEKSVNKKLEENDKKINKLFKKIDKYKNIINFANKNKKRSLASFVLIIKDNDNNFYCDLCPNEIFESYKEVQIHSLSRHEHILKLRKKNYEINNNLTSSYNIEQKYLDTRMKNIQEEFDTLIENINTNKENENIFKNKNDNNNLENVPNEERYFYKINIDETELLHQTIEYKNRPFYNDPFDIINNNNKIKDLFLIK